jgi:hypothetical protein
MKTIKDIRARMIEIVGGKAENLGFINARLVLRTGITLNDNESSNSQDVARVISALKDMGYAVEATGGQA